MSIVRTVRLATRLLRRVGRRSPPCEPAAVPAGGEPPLLVELDVQGLQVAAIEALSRSRSLDEAGAQQQIAVLVGLSTLLLEAGQFGPATFLLIHAAWRCEQSYGVDHPVAVSVRSRRDAAHRLHVYCGYA